MPLCCNCFGTKKRAAANSPSVSVHKNSPTNSLVSSIKPNAKPASVGAGGASQISGHHTSVTQSITQERLWKNAAKRISDKDREVLEPILGDIAKGITKVSITGIEANIEERKIEVEKSKWRYCRWELKKINFDLEKLLDNTLSWIQRFVKIGDILIQYDPVHSALPWAAFRLLLQVAVEDRENMAAIIIGTERVSNLLARCIIFGDLYLDRQLSCEDILEESLTALYSSILTFFGLALRYFDRNFRAVRSLFDTVDFGNTVDTLDKLMKEVDAHVDIARAEVQTLDSQGISRIIKDTDKKLEALLLDLGRSISDIGENTAALVNHMEGKKRAKFLAWLSDIPYESHHEFVKQEMLENTGSWLFKRQDFQDWHESQNSGILWLRGDPGVGKTKLICTIIDTLQSKLQDELIIYFYCARGDQKRNSATAVLRSLMKQFFKLPSVGIPEALYERFQETDKGELRYEETVNFLTTLLATQRKITIVVDALDEILSRVDQLSNRVDEISTKDRVVFLQTLNEIIGLSNIVVKICVSSRHEDDISRALDSIATPVTVAQEDNYDDISRFIEREVTIRINNGRLLGGDRSLGKGGKMDEKLKNEIIQGLSKQAQGMFLWVAFQIEGLCELKQRQRVREALKRLPTNLILTFDHIYNMICRHPEAETAKNALRWVLCAIRPLNPKEWTELVLLAEESFASDADSELDSNVSAPDLDEKDLLDLCHNFVKIDNQPVVRFFHLSVREYLEKKSDFTQQSPDIMAAEGCLSFLCNHQSLVKSTRSFFDYVIQNWAHHARAAAMTPSNESMTRLFELQTKFLMSTSPAFKIWLSHAKSHNTELSDDTDPLFVACHYGLRQICKRILDQDKDRYATVRNQHLRTPLHTAAQQGHADVVQELLAAKGVDVNATDKDNRTPLSSAVFHGHVEVTKLLLTVHGIDANLKDNQGFSPLSRSAWHGDVDMVKILLAARDVNVDVNLAGDGGRTALQWAAFQGNRKVISALLKLRPDIDLNAKDDGNHTALQLATFNGHAEIVRLLLEAPTVDPNCRDVRDWMPLTFATNERNAAIVKLLLGAKGVDVNSADYDGWTALIFAAAEGYEDIAELLLQAKDIDPNLPDDNDLTPLHFAVKRGHENVVEVLLREKAVDFTLMDNSGQTPLILAVHNKHAAITRRLLEAEGITVDTKDLNWSQLSAAAATNDHGVIVGLFKSDKSLDSKQPHVRNDPGLTELSKAARSGDLDLVRQLIFHSDEDVQLISHSDEDVNSKDRGGRTALSWAAQRGHNEIVKLLLTCAEVDVNATDNGLRTPMVQATMNGHVEVVQQLLGAKGVDVNRGDFCGLTPIAWAAHEGNEDILDLLLNDPRVDPDAKGHQHWSPLSWAAQHDKAGTVAKLLRNRHVNVNSKDRDGVTPLAWASKHGHIASVKQLLTAKNIDVDCKDNSGSTPLAQAALNGHAEVVKLLIANNADTNSEDHKKMTPLDCALNAHHHNIIEILRYGTRKYQYPAEGDLILPVVDKRR